MATKRQREIVNIFAKALPTLRKEMGISQTTLGKKIGKSRQMISLIERGEAEMSWDTCLSIVLFFRVNYNRDEKKVFNELEEFLLINEEDKIQNEGAKARKRNAELKREGQQNSDEEFDNDEDEF